MIREEFSRTAMMLGDEAINALSAKRVAVFGVGGVGGYAIEALARAGVGHFLLVDNDTVARSNINRQIIALSTTIGRPKVKVMAERIVDINSDASVECRQTFYLPENAHEIDLSDYDYVIDCIDTVSAKLELACQCRNLGLPMISSMGTGNKTDPMGFTVADLSKTSVCPLARTMRRELKLRGITHLKVVFSTETPAQLAEKCLSERGKPIPASNPFVPPAAGLLIARTVAFDLTAYNGSVGYSPC